MNWFYRLLSTKRLRRLVEMRQVEIINRSTIETRLFGLLERTILLFCLSHEEAKKYPKITIIIEPYVQKQTSSFSGSGWVVPEELTLGRAIIHLNSDSLSRSNQKTIAQHLPGTLAHELIHATQELKFNNITKLEKSKKKLIDALQKADELFLLRLFDKYPDGYKELLRILIQVRTRFRYFFFNLSLEGPAQLAGEMKKGNVRFTPEQLLAYRKRAEDLTLMIAVYWRDIQEEFDNDNNLEKIKNTWRKLSDLLESSTYDVGEYIAFLLLYRDYQVNDFEDILKFAPLKFIKEYVAVETSLSQNPVVSVTGNVRYVNYNEVLTGWSKIIAKIKK